MTRTGPHKGHITIKYDLWQRHHTDFIQKFYTHDKSHVTRHCDSWRLLGLERKISDHTSKQVEFQNNSSFENKVECIVQLVLNNTSKTFSWKAFKLAFVSTDSRGDDILHVTYYWRFFPNSRWPCIRAQRRFLVWNSTAQARLFYSFFS